MLLIDAARRRFSLVWRAFLPLSPEDTVARVDAALKRSAEVDAHRITVEVEGGKVILRGKVRSWAERDEAAREAWAAPGVWTVENFITVEP